MSGSRENRTLIPWVKATSSAVDLWTRFHGLSRASDGLRSCHRKLRTWGAFASFTPSTCPPLRVYGPVFAGYQPIGFRLPYSSDPLTYVAHRRVNGVGAYAGGLSFIPWSFTGPLVYHTQPWALGVVLRRISDSYTYELNTETLQTSDVVCVFHATTQEPPHCRNVPEGIEVGRRGIPLGDFRTKLPKGHEGVLEPLDFTEGPKVVAVTETQPTLGLRGLQTLEDGVNVLRINPVGTRVVIRGFVNSSAAITEVIDVMRSIRGELALPKENEEIPKGVKEDRLGSVHG
jgi:hypothetical protein